jgi:hypothetical protein
MPWTSTENLRDCIAAGTAMSCLPSNNSFCPVVLVRLIMASCNQRKAALVFFSIKSNCKEWRQSLVFSQWSSSSSSFHLPKLNSEYYWQGSDRIHCVCWFLYVSTILWHTHRDCKIFIVRAWCSECVHTLDLGLSSHPKELVQLHAPYRGLRSSLNSTTFFIHKNMTIRIWGTVLLVNKNHIVISSLSYNFLHT